MRLLTRLFLIGALIAGPFGCLPHAGERATTATIGALMTVDLDECIKTRGSWTQYDKCSADLQACAKSAKTVGDYDTCSDKVVGR